jgi:hypothetical protein
MDSSVIIMGVVMVAIFVIPVLLFVRSHKKNKDKDEPTN